jgi:hypothetical protein
MSRHRDYSGLPGLKPHLDARSFTPQHATSPAQARSTQGSNFASFSRLLILSLMSHLHQKYAGYYVPQSAHFALNFAELSRRDPVKLPNERRNQDSARDQ